MAALIEQVRSSTATSRVRILVGGYPFNVEPELWRGVGADSYAPDAAHAIVAAKALMPA